LDAQLESVPTPRWVLWTDRITAALLLASAGVVLAVAAVFFHFAVMVDDDVVRATRPVQSGWFNYVVGFVYMHWQGRWASAGVESAVLPRVDLVRHYWVLIGAVAAVDIAGIFVVIRYGLRVPTARAAGVTAVVAAFLWSGIPSPAEAVYWFTGAVENVMNLSLAAMVVVAVARVRPSIVTAALLGIGAFVVCGFHELYGAMFCLVLATGTAAAFFTGSSRRWLWLAVAVFALIGLIVVVAAPGNMEREHKEHSQHGMQLMWDLRILASQLRGYPRAWIVLDDRLIAATVLLVFSATGAARPGTGRLPWKWVVPPLWIACVVGGFFGPDFAFGNFAIPARTLSGIWLAFVAGFFATVWLWTRDGFWRRPVVLKPGMWVGRVALAVTLLLTGNTAVARSDWKRNLRPWRDSVDRRYAELESGSGRDVVLQPLHATPKLLRTSELYRNGPPVYWKSWSFYFGQKSVRVDPPLDVPPG
jgi:hypothetical protein